MTRLRNPLILAALALPLQLAPNVAQAHELPADRLTLVQRDATHLSLQLYVDLPALMHRCLSPQTPLAAFVLALSSQSPVELEPALQRLRTCVEPKLRLRREGAPLQIANWRWPSVTRVQSLIQQRAMQLVVAPSDHAHDPPEEITADAVSADGMSALSLELPTELQPLMLVNYRPRQRWIDRSSGPIPITF
ncbi:hypothetical protein J7U46_16010 [Pelomonas sp. V22]|uniref:hypothetical protein n=1 Tax=Pelomonas sp. V22 TaxID=2822139 RepID=UPI0024A8F7C8|nr:hypothetical protein [Pelomonas sp. V22]MDI4634565.1 hypothetical protein [Pelomonas sp. V22]